MLESFTPIYSNSVKKYDTLLSAICLLYVLMDDKNVIFLRIIPLMGVKKTTFCFDNFVFTCIPKSWLES